MMMANETKSKPNRQSKKQIYRGSVVHEESLTYAVDTPRKQRSSTVAASRKYAVEFVSSAKNIASGWLKTFSLEKAVGFGLPEIDDRYHIWRVPLVKPGTRKRIGEIVIDAYTSLISVDETTAPDVIEARLLGRSEPEISTRTVSSDATQNLISFVRNTVILGDSEYALLDIPS